MAIKRYAAKRDANESEIVLVLEYIGASVQRLSEKGVPDLLVGIDGRNYLIEVKTDKGRLTADQVAWHQSWAGEVHVVVTVDDVLSVIGR